MKQCSSQQDLCCLISSTNQLRIWVNVALCFPWSVVQSTDWRGRTLWGGAFIQDPPVSSVTVGCDLPPALWGHVCCVQQGTAASFFSPTLILQLCDQVLSSHKSFSFSVTRYCLWPFQQIIFCREVGEGRYLSYVDRNPSKSFLSNLIPA